MIEYLLSEFDADFDALLGLPFQSQVIIFKTIDPYINSLLRQMETLSEETLTSVVVGLATRAKDRRNQALRQGAIDKTNTDWMSAALLEHFYNGILSFDKNAAQHIGKKLMGWMHGMDMIDLDLWGATPLGNLNKSQSSKVVPCPSCKSNFKVPLNKHIEVTCKNCTYKWKMHT